MSIMWPKSRTWIISAYGKALYSSGKGFNAAGAFGELAAFQGSQSIGLSTTENTLDRVDYKEFNHLH